MDATDLVKKFEQIEEDKDFDPTSPEERQKFLQAFIQEINVKYGLNLTIIDACKLVRKNVDSLNLSLEMRNILLATITSLESYPNFSQELYSNTFLRIKGLYWPTEWNWFGLNKKKHKKSRKMNCQLGKAISQLSPNRMDIDLPSSCYIGAIEAFAGVLVLILPIPGAVPLGLGMIGDGARRVADGVMQLGEERRANPNFVPPKLGPPFDTF